MCNCTFYQTVLSFTRNQPGLCQQLREWKLSLYLLLSWRQGKSSSGQIQLSSAKATFIVNDSVYCALKCKWMAQIFFSDLFYFLNKNSERRIEFMSRKCNRIPTEVQKRVQKEKLGNKIIYVIDSKWTASCSVQNVLTCSLSPIIITVCTYLPVPRLVQEHGHCQAEFRISFFLWF